MREAAERRPHGLALDADGREWTWAELDERVDRASAGLAVAGIRPGALVAFLLPPGGAAVETLHAVARLGATAAPLHPGWTPAELATALAEPAPDLLVCDETTAERAEEVRRTDGPGDEGVPLLRLPGVGEPGHAPRGGGRFPGIAAEAALAVLRTSGTAGGRRGAVRLTLANLEAIAEGSRERLGLGPDDRWYGVLSPAHVGGLALLVRAALLGSAVVARPAFDVAELAALAEQERITHASLVPTMLHRILEHTEDAPAPAPLRCLLVGGAPTPPELLERALAAGYPVALTYGLTEASSQVATAPPELVREKPGTVGAPLPGVEVRIDGSGVGEILVRGPTVAARLGGPGGPQAGGEDPGGVGPDRDGWLHTGDLGRLDDDGHLWITGRRSDRIVSGGVTVDPSEVEAALRLHDAVADAAVVGLPDREWGEVVSAAVVPAPGRSLDPEALERHARTHLSGARIPRRIVVAEQIPRNANGKVDREGVAALFKEG